jgi:hypothetical protein
MNALKRYLQLIMAGLLACCVIVEQGRTQEKPGAKLWNDYISAADTAASLQDFKTTEIFLKAALVLAEAMGPEDPRIMLTRVLLNMNYLDQKDNKRADEMAKQFKRIDVSTFDVALLPAAKTFEHLANTYYDRWEETSGKDQDSKDQKILALGKAERCSRIEVAIDTKLLKGDDPALATAVAFYGLIVSKNQNLNALGRPVESFYEEAGKIFESGEIENLERERRSGDFSLMPVYSVQSEHTSQNALLMRLLLAARYAELGDDDVNDKKTEQAHQAYRKAEDNYERGLAIMYKEWPEHSNLANWEWRLADTYKKDDKAERAIRVFYKVLRRLEEAGSMRQDDVQAAAKDLAEVLESSNHKSDAAGIRAKYHVRLESSGHQLEKP